MTGTKTRVRLGFLILFIWAVLAASGCEPWRSWIARMFHVSPELIAIVFVVMPGLFGFFWRSLALTPSMRRTVFISALIVLLAPPVIRFLLDPEMQWLPMSMKRLAIKALLMYPAFYIGRLARWLSERPVEAPQEWR